MPAAVPDLSFYVVVDANTLLLTVLPESVVLASIRPGKDPVALFLVLYVLSLVPSTVVPSKNAFSVHLVEDPVTGVFSVISPFVLAMAMDVVVHEIALEH